MQLDPESALAAFRELALELFRAERDLAPAPPREPEELLHGLPLELDGRGLHEQTVFELLRRIVRATPKTASRRFYNQLFAGRDTMGAVADLLATLLNVSMYTYKVAGPQALIEKELVRKMCALAGYADGDGIFVPGGSLANLVAMMLARNEAKESARNAGLDGETLRVYMSADGHYSVRKNAGILGIGRDNVRTIPVDSEGRMLPQALDQAMTEDRRAGRLPIAVVATAGTTVLGAFDPVHEIAKVAKRHGAWLHVDGALGSSLLLHPRHRRLVRGSERADSLAWNPHKMMGLPLTCSVILVRRRGLLHRDFSEQADYLFQSHDDELNLGTKSIQCGRRNDALKLWAAWKVHGDAGWARRIEHQLDLARHAAEIVAADPGLVLTKHPQSINVCFEVAGKSSVEICDRLNRLGLAQVGHAIVEGRRVIRLVTANPDLEEQDLARFFADLGRLAAELGPGENAVPQDDALRCA